MFSNAVRVAYLHDSYVIGEWSDAQPLDHDVGQMVGVKHQVVPAVLQELLVVLAFILPHVAHCTSNTQRLETQLVVAGSFSVNPC